MSNTPNKLCGCQCDALRDPHMVCGCQCDALRDPHMVLPQVWVDVDPKKNRMGDNFKLTQS
jgi:hypothetical protein